MPVAVRQVVESDLVAQSIGGGARVGRDKIGVVGGDIALIDVLQGIELDGETVEQPRRAEPAAALTKGVVAGGIVVEDEGHAVGRIGLIAHQQAE